MENGFFIVLLIIVIILNTCVVLTILKNNRLEKQTETIIPVKTTVKEPEEVTYVKPKTQLVYKTNVIDIVEPDYPDFPKHKYYYPREYLPFYGYRYGPLYDYRYDKYDRYDPNHNDKPKEQVIQNTINNNITQNPAVKDSFSESPKPKIIKNTHLKDLLQRKPKTVYTSYHPADGKKHTGYVKDITKDKTTYKVFIPDEGTKEGDVYTTSKTFEVEAEPIKETVEVEGKSVEIELSPEQSLQETPTVEVKKQESESSDIKEGFSAPTQKIITLKCGKKVKIIV